VKKKDKPLKITVSEDAALEAFMRTPPPKKKPKPTKRKPAK
jgi:hypothetical protein